MFVHVPACVFNCLHVCVCVCVCACACVRHACDGADGWEEVRHPLHVIPNLRLLPQAWPSLTLCGSPAPNSRFAHF